MDVRAEGFFGFADLEPKARLDLEWASVRRRITLGGYRELRPVNPRGRHLGVGNSLNAFLFGRDFGEYFLATGADLRWRPPEAARQSFEVRLYGERHHQTSNKVEFAVFHAFDGDWSFPPNVEAENVEEAGGEVWLAPWWGSDPLLPQVGLEFYAHGGAWRLPRATEGVTEDAFIRASAILRLAVPLASGRWRVAAEAGGGTTWGTAPVQRSWFLGGPASLRGYPGSVTAGSTFTRGRLEVARVFSVGTLSAFGDVGWAGVREDWVADDLLYGVGVGGSVLDGLIRMDLSYGFDDPLGQFRLDLYLDAIL
jgi:hypothetical protein